MEVKIEKVSRIAVILMGCISLIGAQFVPVSMESGMINDFFEFSGKFAKYALTYSNTSACHSPISATLLMATLASGAGGESREEMFKALNLKNQTSAKIRDNVLDTVRYLELFKGHRMLGSFLASEDGKEEPNEFFKQFPTDFAFDMHHLIFKDIPDDKWYCPGVDDNRSFIASVEHEIHGVRFAKPFTSVISNAIPLDANEMILRGDILMQTNEFRHGIKHLIDAKWVEIPLESSNLFDTLSMMIIMPIHGNSLDKIISNLDTLPYLFENSETSILQLSLPLFDFFAEQHCMDELIWNKLGFKTIFEEKADFLDIFGHKPYPLRFGGSSHQVHLNLNVTIDENYQLPQSNSIYENHPINLSFGRTPIFNVDRSFVGLIVSRQMLHFAFKVIMPEKTN